MRDLPCPAPLHLCSVRICENINEGEKWYLKDTNQDSKSVKCTDTKWKCPKYSEVNSCQGEVNQNKPFGLNYLLDLFSLSSHSFFLLRGEEKKAKQQKK